MSTATELLQESYSLVESRYANTTTLVTNFSEDITAVASVSASPSEIAIDDDLPKYTLSEVSIHDTYNDCWTIIYDRVYDLTTFLNEHPGGNDVLLEYAGRDATLAFRSVGHSKLAESSLEPFCIGVLSDSDKLWTRFWSFFGGR